MELEHARLPVARIGEEKIEEERKKTKKSFRLSQRMY